MSSNQRNTNKSEDSKMAGIGLLMAFTTSLCCITPVLALMSGVGGVASTFSWLEPLRPFLVGLTVAVLGFTWYQKMKPKKEEVLNCDCHVDRKEPFIQSRKFLGIVTTVAVVLLTFPSYSHIFYPEMKANSIISNESSVKQLYLNIKGMTCSGCEEHINHAASQIDGVITTEASYELGTANIKYDMSIIEKKEIIKAINATGYRTVENTEVSEPKENK